MNKLIRDEKGRLIGQIVESGNVSYLRNEMGTLKAIHVKNCDKTYDGQGRYVGNGDQMLRKLDK
jgi:hypothetical protein